MERIGRAEETEYLVGGMPLKVVGEFNYMSRVLDKSGDE